MPRRYRKFRPLISGGRVLVGFNELFDAAWGNPKTPRTSDGGYAKVAPSVVGGTLLPFPCPHCKTPQRHAVDKKRHTHYYDPERGFSWCPTCRGRYVVDRKGVPLEEAVPAGAPAAPARVTLGSEVRVLRLPEGTGLDALGAV